MDNNNESDRLLQLPDNASWRRYVCNSKPLFSTIFNSTFRTHSDSSLHHAMMPTVVAHYHARMENENNSKTTKLVHINTNLHTLYFFRSNSEFRSEQC